MTEEFSGLFLTDLTLLNLPTDELKFVSAPSHAGLQKLAFRHRLPVTPQRYASLRDLLPKFAHLRVVDLDMDGGFFFNHDSLPEIDLSVKPEPLVLPTATELKFRWTHLPQIKASNLTDLWVTCDRKVLSNLAATLASTRLLSKLHISLTERATEFELDSKHAVVRELVKGELLHMRQFSEMKIVWPSEMMVAFQSWPKLRHLSADLASFTQHQLVTLLQRAPFLGFVRLNALHESDEKNGGLEGIAPFEHAYLNHLKLSSANDELFKTVRFTALGVLHLTTSKVRIEEVSYLFKSCSALTHLIFESAEAATRLSTLSLRRLRKLTLLITPRFSMAAFRMILSAATKLDSLSVRTSEQSRSAALLDITRHCSKTVKILWLDDFANPSCSVKDLLDTFPGLHTLNLASSNVFLDELTRFPDIRSSTRRRGLFSVDDSFGEYTEFTFNRKH